MPINKELVWLAEQCGIDPHIFGCNGNASGAIFGAIVDLKECIEKADEYITGLRQAVYARDMKYMGGEHFRKLDVLGQEYYRHKQGADKILKDGES